MKKSEFRALIREEIRKALNEGVEKYTFSGNKNFMSRVAVPIFKKYGIDTAKLKSYDPDSGTTEITVTIDDKIAEKIGNELEAHPRAQDEYGGYFEAEDNLNEGNWTKQSIDRELRDLALGGQEMGGMDDAMAFDIARSWLDDNPGIEDAIKRLYGVTDVVGFVANNIA